MEYMSVKDAAERWGISERQVQRLLSDNRVPGAHRHAKVWLIPSNTAKPADKRRDKSENTACKYILSTALPLTNGVLEPGKCSEAIAGIKDTHHRQIARAEYCFFLGEAQKVMELCEPYTDSEDIGLRLSALLLQAFAALPERNTAKVQLCLRKLRLFYKEIEHENVSDELRALAVLCASTPAVLMRMEHPDIPSLAPYVCNLPDGLQLLGYYVCAYAVYLRGDYGEALGIAKAALSMKREKYLIAEIYLRMVMAMSLMSLKRTSEAQDCFMEAWRQAEPDGLVLAFAEHHGFLHGLVESCLKKTQKGEYSRIISLAAKFNTNWLHVDDPDADKNMVESLTTMELTIAMLASRAWTNIEIASHLNLSVHTVKKYISDVYQKLDISSRKQLARYLQK